MTRVNATSRVVLVSIAAAVVGALGVTVVALGITQSPNDDYWPYGISPEDATRITNPEKRRLWNEDLAIYRTARAGTPGPRGTLVDLPFETPVPERTGIIDAVNPLTNLIAANAWFGEWGGSPIKIYAGYARYDETLGVVAVKTGEIWTHGSTVPGAGKLTIASVENGTVSLIASSGEPLQFDLATMTLSGRGIPVPTSTSSIPLAARLALDLEPKAGGVQSVYSIARGASVEIAVVVLNVTTPYAGYQWRLQWDDATLDFDSHTENTAGHGGTLCSSASATSDPSQGVPAGKEWAGPAGCVRTSGTTTFAGDLATITVRCAAAGTTEIALVPYVEGVTDGSTLFGADAAPIATAYAGATLTCQQ